MGVYLANIFQGRIEYELMYSSLFSSYSMRPRKIFALLLVQKKTHSSAYASVSVNF